MIFGFGPMRVTREEDQEKKEYYYLLYRFMLIVDKITNSKS
ncbi:hypothetical protein BH24BAC1_BH24BAC1_32610 [soil metagenome]